MWTLWVMVLPATASLLMAVEVCRHGARAPNQIFPFHSAYWKDYVPGQLTALGQRQAFLLGVEMRRRYVEEWDLFNGTYHPSEVYVQSTNVDRALETAYSQLTGLFPPSTGRKIPTGRVLRPPLPVKYAKEIEKELGIQALPHLIQSVPIHSNDSDHVLHGYKGEICPRMEQIKGNVKKLPEYGRLEERGRDLLSSLSHLLPNGSLTDLKRLYSGLTCDIAQGNPLPFGLDLDSLRLLHRDIVLLTFTDPEAQILSCSEFFKRLLSQFHARLTGKQLRFALYSAHDYTLIAFLECLGAEIVEVPSFASTLVFELYVDGKVAVVYNGAELPCAACPEGRCQLAAFQTYMHRFTVSDIKQACESQ